MKLLRRLSKAIGWIDNRLTMDTEHLEKVRDRKREQRNEMERVHRDAAMRAALSGYHLYANAEERASLLAKAQRLQAEVDRLTAELAREKRGIGVAIEERRAKQDFRVSDIISTSPIVKELRNVVRDFFKRTGRTPSILRLSRAKYAELVAHAQSIPGGFMLFVFEGTPVRINESAFCEPIEAV